MGTIETRKNKRSHVPPWPFRDDPPNGRKSGLRPRFAAPNFCTKICAIIRTPHSFSPSIHFSYYIRSLIYFFSLSFLRLFLLCSDLKSGLGVVGHAQTPKRGQWHEQVHRDPSQRCQSYHRNIRGQGERDKVSRKSPDCSQNPTADRCTIFRTDPTVPSTSRQSVRTTSKHLRPTHTREEGTIGKRWR